MTGGRGLVCGVAEGVLGALGELPVLVEGSDVGIEGLGGLAAG